MRSEQQQKAELLDEFMALNDINLTFNDNYKVLKYKYNSLINQKTLTKDPFIDEVLSGRLINSVADILNIESTKFIRLSDCPRAEKLAKMRGIGLKSIREYSNTMEKYSFFDKIYQFICFN